MPPLTASANMTAVMAKTMARGMGDLDDLRGCRVRFEVDPDRVQPGHRSCSP
jgi:hypothetical protein